MFSVVCWFMFVFRMVDCLFFEYLIVFCCCFLFYYLLLFFLFWWQEQQHEISPDTLK